LQRSDGARCFAAPGSRAGEIRDGRGDDFVC
jgi:hypothetical protein